MNVHMLKLAMNSSLISRSFGPLVPVLGALPYILGALTLPTLESFACAPSTDWRAQTSPAVGWCSWPDPGNASCDARTDT